MGLNEEVLRTPLKDFEYIWNIPSTNFPTVVQIDSNEILYNIDLETRQIEAPKYLGAECDHESEIIFFKVGRYQDGMDLATTTCYVSYQTTNRLDGTPYYGFAAIPFYDTLTLSATNEMIIPWALDSAVTQSPGKIKFNFRFFKLDEKENLIYNLSTSPTTSQVLNTINPLEIDVMQDRVAPAAEQLITLVKNLAERDRLYWEFA